MQAPVGFEVERQGDAVEQRRGAVTEELRRRHPAGICGGEIHGGRLGVRRQPCAPVRRQEVGCLEAPSAHPVTSSVGDRERHVHGDRIGEWCWSPHPLSLPRCAHGCREFSTRAASASAAPDPLSRNAQYRTVEACVPAEQTADEGAGRLRRTPLLGSAVQPHTGPSTHRGRAGQFCNAALAGTEGASLPANLSGTPHRDDEAALKSGSSGARSRSSRARRSLTRIETPSDRTRRR